MCYWYSVHYQLEKEEGLTGKGVHQYEFAEYSSLNWMIDRGDAMWIRGGK